MTMRAVLWFALTFTGSGCTDALETALDAPLAPDDAGASDARGSLDGHAGSDGALADAAMSQGAHWYKGQLHAHTTNSFDGSESVSTTVSMYQGEGYDFIAISDHNYVTSAEPFNTSTFLIIPNDELSLGSGATVVPGYVSGPIHVNAVNVDGAQPPGSPTTLPGVIDLALSAGATAQINHPAASSLSPSTILASPGATPMEVIQGPSDLAANTAIWDAVLSAGMRLYATGTDDFHNSGNFNRAWIMVLASSLTRSDIMTAIEHGHFYASNGPTLSTITRSDRTLTVSSSGIRVTFVGRNGAVLDTVNAGSASYTLPADGVYVRAVVTDASGRVAYTQPYFP
jgi:hypothetical protein